MLLKEIGRKIAQAFRLARAADEKVASSIAAVLDAKAEQIKEYEKRFEPELRTRASGTITNATGDSIIGGVWI